MKNGGIAKRYTSLNYVILYVSVGDGVLDVQKFDSKTYVA